MWQGLLRHDRHELTIGGARIVVDDDVFTPDPEKSYSAQMIIDHLPPLAGMRVLDIGTGTGVLAIVAALRGAQEAIASDVSEAAVENASRNVETNHVEDRVRVVRSDLFENIDGTFDYMLANLPISEEFWKSHGRDVGPVIDRFFEQAQGRLVPGGKILLAWGSFAESRRDALEEMLVHQGYSFQVVSTEALRHTWYLYTITRI